MSDDKVIAEARTIVAKIAPVVFPALAGRGSAVQSIVLVDLLATWLAGHFVPGDVAATRGMRTELLAEALLVIDQLVAIEAKRIGTPHDPIKEVGRA